MGRCPWCTRCPWCMPMVHGAPLPVPDRQGTLRASVLCCPVVPCACASGVCTRIETAIHVRVSPHANTRLACRTKSSPAASACARCGRASTRSSVRTRSCCWKRPASRARCAAPRAHLVLCRAPSCFWACMSQPLPRDDAALLTEMRVLKVTMAVTMLTVMMMVL